MVIKYKILGFFIILFTGCSNQLVSDKDYIAINDFLINDERIFGDSLSIISSYGIPDTKKIYGENYFWQYENEYYFLSFIKEGNGFELDVLHFKKIKSNIIKINGIVLQEDNFESDNFKKIFGNCAFNFNVSRDKYSAVRFRSDRESMRPILFFENKVLKEILF